MSLKTLRVDPAPPAVRLLLVWEVFGFAAAVTVYSWFAMPTGGHLRPIHYVFLPLAVPFPFLMNWLHSGQLKRSGVRLDNARASAREAVPLMLGVAAVIVAIGFFAEGFHGSPWFRLFKKSFKYLGWGPVQQYVLCAFSLRRLLQAGFSKPAAVTWAALLFGLVHTPNWALVSVTTTMGALSCVLFLRNPNVFVLGLAHGVIAILVYYTWPIEWHQKLRIGGNYIERVRRTSQVSESGRCRSMYSAPSSPRTLKYRWSGASQRSRISTTSTRRPSRVSQRGSSSARYPAWHSTRARIIHEAHGSGWPAARTPRE